MTSSCTTELSIPSVDKAVDNFVHLGISVGLSPASVDPMRRTEEHVDDTRGRAVVLTSNNRRSPQSTGPTSPTESFSLSFFLCTAKFAVPPTASGSTNMVAARSPSLKFVEARSL
jgi:hypothetical protein